MKSKTFAIILFCVSIWFLGCNQPSQESSNTDVDSAQHDSEDSTSRNAVDKIIERLNDWDKDELIAYNEPERFPKFKTSGETNGWIESCMEELANLEATVEWNRKDSKYLRSNQD